MSIPKCSTCCIQSNCCPLKLSTSFQSHSACIFTELLSTKNKNGGIKSTFSKFPDNTRLCRAGDRLEGRDAIHRALGMLEVWPCEHHLIQQVQGQGPESILSIQSREINRLRTTLWTWIWICTGGQKNTVCELPACVCSPASKPHLEPIPQEGWPVGWETSPGVLHPVSQAPGRHGQVGSKERTQKWSESWSTSPMKTNWEHWNSVFWQTKVESVYQYWWRMPKKKFHSFKNDLKMHWSVWSISKFLAIHCLVLQYFGNTSSFLTADSKITSQVYLRNEIILKLSKPYSMIYSRVYIYNSRTNLNEYRIVTMQSRWPRKFREIMVSELKKPLLVNSSQWRNPGRLGLWGARDTEKNISTFTFAFLHHHCKSLSLKC